MKKYLIFTLSLIIVFVNCFCFDKLYHNYTDTSSVSNAYIYKTVVIDAGHGGKDAGAIGVDGSNEKDINLNIALKLYDYLMVCGVKSVLTRDGDYETYYNKNDDKTKSDLYNRMDLVNSINNSILVSIHQNHFSNEAEWGTQIWYSANTKQSEIIADSILSTVKYFLQPGNKRINKVSDNSYYLLYKAKSPSVMVECGFVSNANENKKLQNKTYQNKMAYSILVGLIGVI